MYSNRKMKVDLGMTCIFSDLQTKKRSSFIFRNLFLQNTYRFQQFQKSRGSSHTAVALLMEWVQPCALFKKKGPVFFRGSHGCGRAKQIQRHFCRWFLGSVMFRPKGNPPLNSLNISVSRICCLKHLGDDSPKKSWSDHSGVSGVWVENSFRILHDFPLQIEGIQ